jgi:hypothetical protein
MYSVPNRVARFFLEKQTKMGKYAYSIYKTVFTNSLKVPKCKYLEIYKYFPFQGFQKDTKIM